MIEIRKHQDVGAALYITGLGFKLPNDHSWVALSDKLSNDQIESSENLANAFRDRLIEINISGDYSDAPSWYLDMFVSSIKVPEELLEEDESVIQEKLQDLKESAHPILWRLVRMKLLEEEIEGHNRANVLDMLIAL